MENFETAETVEAIDSVKENIARRPGGDKYMQAMREAMDRLIGAVDLDNYDVDEYDVLGRIMVRSGLMWRCVNHDCNGINHNNCTSCDNCNARRPKAREVPKADTWA